jgi:hypothetical protein
MRGEALFGAEVAASDFQSAFAQARSTLAAKQSRCGRAQGGEHGLNSYQLSFLVKVAWALKRGKWPQKGVI